MCWGFKTLWKTCYRLGRAMYARSYAVMYCVLDVLDIMLYLLKASEVMCCLVEGVEGVYSG